MSRGAWLIGCAGVAAVVFVSIAASADEPPATAGSAPTSTVATEPITVTVTTTTPRATSTTSSSTSTTSTSTSTSTTTSTTTTVPRLDNRKFDPVAFDAQIAAATVDRGDLSAGVAVIRNGAVLHAAAFGMENPFEARAADPRTRFRIASVSKMLTVVAVMQLVEDGSILLDEPFAGQVGLDGPYVDPRVGTVTVRQLLSHMSGFAISRNLFFGRGVETWHDAAAAAFGQVLMFDPGTAFQYSNTNYCLLGLLLESVTGRPFESVITENVLEPLGIHAHLAPTVDTDPHDALHASGPGRNYMEVLGPAGGWVATPTDIAKLAASLRSDSPGVHLLDRRTVDTMRIPVPVPVEIPPPVSGWSYGLGLMLFADGSWGHTGTIESTHAIVVNRPDGLTVSVLVSGNVPGNSDELGAVIDTAVAASFR